MNAQHKASLEKTLQSALKHKKAGTEVATTILAIEALVSSGIDTSAIVENTNAEVVGRIRAACTHKAFGKRLADAVSTLEAIIATEGITATIVKRDISGSAPYKAKITKVITNAMTRKDIGVLVANTINTLESVVDELIVIYGTPLEPKHDEATAEILQAIKEILAE